MDKFKKFFYGLSKEVNQNLICYFLLALVIAGTFFIRTYRTTDLMAFHYDQARDALKIWDFWHKGDIFLVGPVTGLPGIFLGPLYYVLIAPLYLLGGGNPLYPSVFLGLLGTLAVVVVFLLGKEMHSRETGLIASFISGFSYYLMISGRWVSNPTPILLTSVVFFYALYRIINNSSKYWWIIVSAVVSASLQFESASAFFYLPVVLTFYIWQKKHRPEKRTIILAGLVFLLSIVPQIIFSIVHQNMLIENFANIFLKEKGFKLSIWQVIPTRLNYFWTVFSSKIFPTREKYVLMFLFLSALGIYSWKGRLKSEILKLFLIFLGIPMLGYILFQGNHGNIYDYYMTGYYLPMVLLFSIGLGVLWNKSVFGKIVVGIFIVWFVNINFVLVRYFLVAGVDGPTHISLGNELQAVRWTYNDAKGNEEFNADFYVPPVIPYTYDYLFLWQGSKICGDSLCGLKKDKMTPIVYVLYEVDPPHPERLENWLAKYKNTSTILKEVSFGGITVQKRLRIEESGN